MNILVAGAGKIGGLLSQLLAHRPDTHVLLVDKNEGILVNIPQSENLSTLAFDISSKNDLSALIADQSIETIVSSLPYFCNIPLAELAATLGLHYFDLTEDVPTVSAIKAFALGKSTAFVPRCGVAPGYINLLANDMMQAFDTLDTVKLRAGCLPKYVSNSLQYALTWSIDGLINEYGNVCEAISEAKPVLLQPLQDLESIELDGVIYEAFNTSGGIGDLVNLYEGRVDQLNYKTIRYPGHCERMRFLMQELYLNEDRDTLRRVLLRALPKIDNDVMIIYLSVTGTLDGEFVEKSVVQRIHPGTLYGQRWSGIQMATANSAAAVIDIVLSHSSQYQGFIQQESISLKQFMQSKYAQVFE